MKALTKGTIGIWENVSSLRILAKKIPIKSQRNIAGRAHISK
jgi:hypothetical protein